MKGILLCVFAFAFFAVPYAHASQIGLGSTRNLFDIQLVQGILYEDDITIFNLSEDIALPVHVEFSLWDVQETGDIEFVLAEPSLNAAQWFSVSEQDFMLSPDESRSVNVRIDAPENVSPGSYFVMMRFQALLAADAQRISTIPELGVMFFLRIPLLEADEHARMYAADIESFGSKNPKTLPLIGRKTASVYEDMAREFFAQVRNTGIYHFQASGSIEIKNIFGMTVAKASLPERYLLPGRVRELDIYIPEQSSFWGRLLEIGPYSATMVLNMPDGQDPVVAAMSFFAFPWKAILGSLLALGIAFFTRKRITASLAVLFRRT